jgi:hypothetical protein
MLEVSDEAINSHSDDSFEQQKVYVNENGSTLPSVGLKPYIDDTSENDE